MSKSTRNIGNLKVDFYKIRHKKADYIKHFVQKIMNYSKLAAVGGTGFVAAAIIFTGVSGVYAQPTATPPNGNVSPNFSRLTVNGETNLGDTEINMIELVDSTLENQSFPAVNPVEAKDLTIYGPSRSTNFYSNGNDTSDVTLRGRTNLIFDQGNLFGLRQLNSYSGLGVNYGAIGMTFTGSFGNPVSSFNQFTLGGNGISFNLDTPDNGTIWTHSDLLVNGPTASGVSADVAFRNNINLVFSPNSILRSYIGQTANSTGYQFTFDKTAASSGIKIDDNLRIRGVISNDSATDNSGRVVIADDLEVRGNIVPQTSGGFINLNAPLKNTATLSGGDLPFRIEDNLLVVGNIDTGTGTIQGQNLYAANNITALGEIGSYFRVRATNTSVTNYATIGSRQSVQVTCPTNTYAVSCSGYLWDSANLAEYVGAEKGLNTQSCTSYARRKAAGTMTLNTNFTHYAEVVCFDPSSTTRTDSN